MPSLRLLRSFTLKGVILLVSMMPLIIPMASQSSESMLAANTLLLNRSESDRTAMISMTLQNEMSGCSTKNCSAARGESLPSASII